MEFLKVHAAASLLGLSPELRLPIYEQVFRIEQWEDQIAQQRANHSTSAVVTPASYLHSHGEFRNAVFPRCRLTGNGNKIRVTGYYADADARRGPRLLHRAAILRTCRLVYREAVEGLYASTPFSIGVTQYVDGFDRFRLSFEPEHAYFLQRIERLTINIAVTDSRTAMLQKKDALALMRTICKEREPSTTSLEFADLHPTGGLEVWLTNRSLKCHCYIPGDGLQFVPSGQEYAQRVVMDIKDIMDGGSPS